MSDRITDEITRIIFKGDTLIRLGKEEEAFVVFDKLIKDYSDDPKVCFEIGERYRRLINRNAEIHKNVR